jgi:hypothetical protein
VDARALPARRDLRVVVAFDVRVVGLLEHLLGAKLDADAASFAALWQDIDLPVRNPDFVEINRPASKHVHETRAQCEKHRILSENLLS